MFIAYILVTLLFGFACMVVGAWSIMSRKDGVLIVKKFNEDGSSMCHVKLTLTPEEFRKRTTVTLRCREIGDRE